MRDALSWTVSEPGGCISGPLALEFREVYERTAQRGFEAVTREGRVLHTATRWRAAGAFLCMGDG